MKNWKILLASGSPRRSFLLDELDIAYRVFVSNVDEIIPPNMEQTNVPEYLATLKGEACVGELRADEILIAADTVVLYDNEIIGKPLNRMDAVNILNRLSGKKHDVISGVFMTDGRKVKSFSVRTVVAFDELTKDEIDYYVDQYKPMDKAGSYGIQEWVGWSRIESINGSYSNIMGLPTREVYNALLEF